MANIQFDGLNVHHKWSIKKPLGGKNSFVQQNISHPLPAILAPGLGSMYTANKADSARMEDEARKKTEAENAQDASSLGDLSRLASEEEMKRRALGQQQMGQINTFADTQQGRVNDFRKTLAANLADTGQQLFTQMNPSILEDLNSRGLFTSQTARDQAQASALKDIALQNQGTLSAFDQSEFNNLNDIRGSALSAGLGGDQSALDAALELKKASIQRSFDQADQARQQSQAEMLAKRKSRDDMISSILNLGGTLGASALCFDPATLIETATGEKVQMKDVDLGDVLSDGGVVISARDAITQHGTFFDYGGVKVTGYHAVMEDGKWVRVGESQRAKPLAAGGVIRTLGTTTHRLFINGIEFADELETDEFNKIDLDESLRRLNAEMVEA